MEDIVAFDILKTKVLKYILYKKRTEQEIRRKFSNENENLLDEVIEYLKEAGYINDMVYIERAVNEFINLRTLSIREICYKLYCYIQSIALSLHRKFKPTVTTESNNYCKYNK